MSEKTTHSVSMVTEVELTEAFDRVASGLGLNRSQAMRQAMRDFIDAHITEVHPPNQEALLAG